MRKWVLSCLLHRQVKAYLRWALLCLLVLASVSVEAGLRPLICRRAQADRVSFQNLFLSLDTRFMDGFSGEQHIRFFWETHKRFGFVRTESGRILLGTKNLERAQQLIAELRRYSGQLTADAPQVKDSPIQRGLVFDVTEIVTSLIRDRLDLQPADMGPNCWNLCLVHAGIAKHFRFVSDLEFRHWLESPLAEPIRSVDDLKPGDLFALVDPDGEVHGAVAISADLVLNKTGSDSMFGVRLMDMREMLGFYADLKPRPKLQVYRIKSLEKLIEQGSYQMPPILQKHWLEVEGFEARMSAYFQGDAGVDPAALAREFKLYNARTAPFILAELERLKAKKPRTEEDRMSLFVGVGLIRRMHSMLEFGSRR